jgi:hypothetical protein
MKERPMIYMHSRPVFENGKWRRTIEEREVILMAVAGKGLKYAMVRAKGGMPYVAELRELKEIPNT